VHLLPRDETTTLDSIYVRDASIVCDRGLILCRMGKSQRVEEPAAQERAAAAGHLPVTICGRIEPPGRLEGGDVIWLDGRTLVVGRGLSHQRGRHSTAARHSRQPRRASSKVRCRTGRGRMTSCT
jgi:N-dimethylarginine dimethylaminohydrolase